MQRVELLAVPGLPMVKAGDDLARLIGERLTGDLALRAGDVLVLAQKIVSKAEGRLRSLSSVIPGAEARKLAAVLGKEPAMVELILEESREVLRAERGVLIRSFHNRGGRLAHCLRVTIGTREENDRFLDTFQSCLASLG